MSSAPTFWYYCCLALPAREEALRRDLGEFLMTGEFFGTREPENVRHGIAGYSTRAESIWVRPYRLNDKLLTTNPEGEPGFPVSGRRDRYRPSSVHRYE